MYDEDLQELMWLFLNRLEKFLPLQTFHQVDGTKVLSIYKLYYYYFSFTLSVCFQRSQVSSVFDVSCILEECVLSVSQCDDVKTLLQYHKDLGQLDHGGKSGSKPQNQFTV